MGRWKTMALAAVGAEVRPTPDFDGKLPMCTNEDCPNYDGKRCRLTGFRTARYCEPVLEAMADMARTLSDDQSG